jgi:hypothetical protein
MSTLKRFHFEKPEFIRMCDAVKVFPFGEEKLKEIAREIGALRKYSNCVYINYDMMKEFLDSCLYVDEDGR